MQTTRTLHLGPRARHTVRFVAALINPLVLLIAGRRWNPVVGILRHRGRRTGRIYEIPLGMRPTRNGFVLPLTLNEHSAWYQNVLASGEAEIGYRGRSYRVTKPEVIEYAAAAPAFPRYERAQFRLIGIGQFLRLTNTE